MRNMLESIVKENSEDPQKAWVAELADFSKKHNIGSDELFAAYQMALGSAPEKVASGETISEEVYSLAKRMDELMNKGLSANIVAELIDTKRNYEVACEDYYALVDSFQMNDRGKATLKSIVERKRSGALIINGEDEIDIPKEVTSEDYSRNVLALTLMQHLQKYENEKIEINFTE